MSAITEALVREKLSTVKYPGFSRDIVSFGLVKEVRVSGDDVLVQLSLATNDPRVPQAIKEGSEAALAHGAHRHPSFGAGRARGGRRADGRVGDSRCEACDRRGQREGWRG